MKKSRVEEIKELIRDGYELGLISIELDIPMETLKEYKKALENENKKESESREKIEERRKVKKINTKMQQMRENYKKSYMHHNIEERPSNLDDYKKDKLDQFMTKYMIVEENKREKLINEISKELGMKYNEIKNYIDLYMRTVKAISDSVVGIASKEINFNNKKIAEHTKLKK